VWTKKGRENYSGGFQSDDGKHVAQNRYMMLVYSGGVGRAARILFPVKISFTARIRQQVTLAGGPLFEVLPTIKPLKLKKGG